VLIFATSPKALDNLTNPYPIDLAFTLTRAHALITPTRAYPYPYPTPTPTPTPTPNQGARPVGLRRTLPTHARAARLRIRLRRPGAAPIYLPYISPTYLPCISRCSAASTPLLSTGGRRWSSILAVNLTPKSP